MLLLLLSLFVIAVVLLLLLLLLQTLGFAITILLRDSSLRVVLCPYLVLDRLHSARVGPVHRCSDRKLRHDHVRRAGRPLSVSTRTTSGRFSWFPTQRRSGGRKQGKIGDLVYSNVDGTAVSYTHLTLPTNREV